MSFNPVLLDLPRIIKTSRLMLKPPSIGEGKKLYASVSENLARLGEWLPWANKDYTEESAEKWAREGSAKWILRSDMPYLMWTPDGKELIGGTGLHRINWDVRCFEIGYWIREKFEGQGYIQESTLALTHFAFDKLDANRVEIRCDVKNERSAAVPRKLGYKLEGVLEKSACGTFCEPKDVMVFARTKKEGLTPLSLEFLN